MPTKKTASPATVARRDRALDVEISHVPFVPPALIGRRFVARDADSETNWLGGEAFVVLGDIGPHVVSGRHNNTGKAYVYPAGVALEVDGTFFTVSREEFMQLTAAHYALAPVKG